MCRLLDFSYKQAVIFWLSPSCQLLALSQLTTGWLQYFNCSVTSKLWDGGLAMYSKQSASGPFPCMSDAVTSKSSASVLSALAMSKLSTAGHVQADSCWPCSILQPADNVQTSNCSPSPSCQLSTLSNWSACRLRNFCPSERYLYICILVPREWKGKGTG
jgi:hypothetical protein